MVDDGLDLEHALRRVARQHDINLQRRRPSTQELRSAISDYRELFRPQQAQRLAEQRRIALTAMKSFAEFQPRLIGSLLHGDGPLDSIRLLLYADTPEQVMMHLRDRRMPWRDAEVTLNYSGGRRLARPTLRFMAGQTAVELVILDENSRSDPPRDPLDGGPLEMLSIAQLGALLGELPA